MFIKSIFVGLALCLGLFGCSQKQEDTGAKISYGPAKAASSEVIYHLAIHPLHNPVRLTQSYLPLVDYLNKNLNIPNVKIEIESSTNYQAYVEKIKLQSPELLLPNPWQALLAIDNNYHIIAMAGNKEDFKGVLLVRKDSNIKSIADLKGKRISYPSYTALAACIMPQRFLFDNGINPNTDIENYYVGSQESSIENVFLKQTDVGVTWPPPWRLYQIDHPTQASELRVLAETEFLVNNSFMVRRDVPKNIAARIEELLIALDKDITLKPILDASQTSKFTSARNDDYFVVKDYVTKFEKDVRLVDLTKMPSDQVSHHHIETNK